MAVVYDTVTRWGWSVNIRNHQITVLIDQVLAEDWDWEADGGSTNRTVPEAKPEEDCVVSAGASWRRGY